MTIISAKFANMEETAVILQTGEAGAVALDLMGSGDNSGGWRTIFEEWIQNGGAVAEYEPPQITETIESFAARNGYGVFELLNLKDMEDALRAASVEIPPKAAAVREWINSTRQAFALGQAPQNAPHSYAEVQAEIIAILNP